MAKCGMPAIAEEMKRLAEKRNTELDPSGKAWSKSRGHDEVDKSPEEPSSEPANNVQRTEGSQQQRSKPLQQHERVRPSHLLMARMISSSPTQDISSLTPGMMGP